MTLEQLSAILKQTGYPVAFESFSKKEAPAMPYICYLAPQVNNFYADGVVYYSATRISVMLYTNLRDLTAEGKVEAVLTANGITWTKDADYNEREKCYEIIYEIEV